VFFVQAATVFAASVAVFLSLRTTHYLAVDGAIRALGVYYNPPPFIHGNNHLLYPINVLVWMRLLHALGVSPRDPFQFMAAAQAMNAVAAAGCLAIFYSTMAEGRNRAARIRTRLVLCCRVLSGCAAGLFSIYGLIYYHSGVHTVSLIARRFLRVDGGANVYGRFTAGKIANLPIGLTANVVPSLPTGYGGLHTLLLPATRPGLPGLLLAILTIVGWLVAVTFTITKKWESLNARRRVILLCCAVTLAADAFPLVYWDPLYDKLWLQPLAVVLLGCAVVLTNPDVEKTHLRLRPIGIPLLALMAGVNLAVAVNSSSSPTPFLTEAQKVSTFVRPGDLVIAEWDDISLLYASFWARGVNVFSLPMEAGAHGIENSRPS
jgi:hypothetical protein